MLISSDKLRKWLLENIPNSPACTDSSLQATKDRCKIICYKEFGWLIDVLEVDGDMSFCSHPIASSPECGFEDMYLHVYSALVSNPEYAVFDEDALAQIANSLTESGIEKLNKHRNKLRE